MGHGVRSALVTAVARGLIEELLPTANEPGKFLTQLNHSLMAILRRTRTPMFASAFFLVADIENSVIRFANAGHPSPLHLRRSSQVVEQLRYAGNGAGPALGIDETFVYHTYECELAERDLIILFTDGLFEVTRGEEEFGEDRLLKTVEAKQHLPATPMLDEVLSEIQSFADNKLFDDDVCIMGMEVMHTKPSSSR
jgi:serine phosphatase RsbU (regulator of sigma subunit)